MFSIRWVILKSASFKSVLRRCFPSIAFLYSESLDWTRLDPVDIVAYNGDSSCSIKPPSFGSLVLFDWNFRTPKSVWRDWVTFSYLIEHSKVGGVSTFQRRFKLAVHSSSRTAFSSRDSTGFPTYPMSDLGSILECKPSGVEVLATRLPRLKVPVVKMVDHGALHHRGLFPWEKPASKVLAPCVFVKNGMVVRSFTTGEQLAIRDVPVSLTSKLSAHEQRQLLAAFSVPAKCFQEDPSSGVACASGALLVASSCKDPTNDSLEKDTSSSHLPGNWLLNTKQDKSEEAAKHDNAAVPISLWNNHLALKLGFSVLTEGQEAALVTLRDWISNKIWKRSVTRCFCGWLRCRSCKERHFAWMFDAGSKNSQNNESSILGCCDRTWCTRMVSPDTAETKRAAETVRGRTCNVCERYWRNTLKWRGIEWRSNSDDKKVEDGLLSGAYVWSKEGREDYKRWYRMFIGLERGGTEDRLNRKKDLLAGRDCIERTMDCSVWTWDRGSRLFFWRWGEFLKDVRDGAKIYVQGKLPQCNKRQRVPKDPEIHKKVQSKLQDVRRKSYITSGNVKSVTSFFEVPKGDSDIRMVYNGTSSGLNDAVWAPWFSLPTVESHLRAVSMNTFMCDCDLSEMFLNFLLDEDIRQYAGVDFTDLFPEERQGNLKLWEHWCRMLMGFKPSPYCTTRDVKRIESFLKGRMDDPNNPFRWYKIVLNLPGMKKYDPSLPWVFKIRTDGTMAGDLFIYIDDLRVAAPNGIDAWEGAHQVCCRLTWLGLQDAPRKRREASQTPGAWAGSVIHTGGDSVSVLVSEKKWDKTKKWIKWLKDNVNNKEGMDFKMLESCRGYLIYVSRTYLPMKPYLRGIHKTIDGWRPGRDSEGWKLAEELYKINKDLEEAATSPSRSDISRVKPVPRLKGDIDALDKLTHTDAPPKVVRRRNKSGTVAYGFGDASGKGFGHAICIEGITRLEFGQWNSTIEEKHSNYKELQNLVNAVKNAFEAGALEGVELFLFTDNFVSECAYYNGGSNHSKELDAVIFDLWQIQMAGTFTLHVFHVAGTRMIECGVDGLSRGDKSEGIARGMDISTFIPIHLSPLERSKGIMEWIWSWWKKEEFGNLELLSPEGWYSKSMDVGSFLWDVAPAAGDAAVEQLCSHIHGRPGNTHLFLIPRLCTSRWRKQLSKATDVIVTVEPRFEFWNADMHEPLMLAIYLPLLPPLTHLRPWKLKHSILVEKFTRDVRGMQASGERMDWSILQQLLSQAFSLPTMSHELARSVLQEEK